MGKVGKAIAKPFEAVGHAVKHVIGGVGKHVIAPILGTGGGNNSSSGNSTVEYQAGAAAPGADPTNTDINVETDATKRKKRAIGKKSLMIGNGSDASGGGTTGTGLNL